MEFRNILFPVDISGTSPMLAPYVIGMARKHQAQVHLLFVVRGMEYFNRFYISDLSIEEFTTEIIQGAEKRLEEFYQANMAADLPDARRTVLTGDVPDTILKYVGDEKIDLIVMGTHGRRGLEKVFFGSVAERIVKSAPVPVMTINPYKNHCH